MDITSLIIEAVSGAVGGNVAGAAMKESSLGVVGNCIAGIVGGGIGGTILHTLMGAAATGGGGMDLNSILTNVGGGGVGGAILMAVVGIIKSLSVWRDAWAAQPGYSVRCGAWAPRRARTPVPTSSQPSVLKSLPRILHRGCRAA